ncbi:winged helix-turn-helix transcriptional regulator [Streptococcus pantholopis]|uniref:HTH hxlR-type domain-containing protein n=1 Tax=Streptococcus pantholopis TaxID=1811193 RepID=A0A172Q6P1_9STRE|nr:helix-turn-helix domain-containing protein [Streptococcus pantholopis]AND79111.1 hypothetical protein A0O21_03260 [Streptococcus pantholopis]
MLYDKSSKVYELGINYILAIIKGKWKVNILCALGNKPFRYNALLDSLNRAFGNRITQKVLTNQLRELENDGLIMRTEIKSSYPKIVYYSLTPKGIKVAELVHQFSIFGEKLIEDSEDIEILYKFSDI